MHHSASVTGGGPSCYDLVEERKKLREEEDADHHDVASVDWCMWAHCNGLVGFVPERDWPLRSTAALREILGTSGTLPYSRAAFWQRRAHCGEGASEHMGSIREEATGRTFVLESHHLVGRSGRCSLQSSEPSVSGEHASLRWTGHTWVVKDLGSRYGTFVNGIPLKPGVPSPLEKGARLTFGRERLVWVMVEDEPPREMIVPLGGGPALFAADGLIAIPSQERPAAVVFQGGDGRWMLERTGDVQVVQEHVPFSVDGAQWLLCNIAPLQPTSVIGDGRESRALEEARLCFEVSRNEEHVHLSALWRQRPIDLGTRAHHYVLLTLARLRLRDPAPASPGAGWIDQDELLRLLQFGAERLNLDIYRARQQFNSVGFVPAAGIVERRPSTKELRLGVADVIIEVV